ncbi:MAG: putative heterodisulfide reductase, subunit, partial [Deltaproteobacteria bacterium]|nr:putative heterodisulfide reductase, subunit [Deltaproteobacteria bacterium]
MDTEIYTPLRLDEIDSALQRELKEKIDIDIETCLECGKCSGGCSNGHIFDYTPRKIVQLVKLGDEETLAGMDALWICLSCQLCLDRCPSGIDIPRILDYLREKAVTRGVKASRPDVHLFMELMLEEARDKGRVSEVPLMIRFKRKTGQYLKDAGLGFKMFLKGKLSPF